jgi:hypothetical protein
VLPLVSLQLVPLYASAPQNRGGLALKPRQLSGPLAFSGAVFLVYAAVGYPRFQRRFGIRAALLVSTCYAVVCLMVRACLCHDGAGFMLCSMQCSGAWHCSCQAHS